MIVFAEIYGDGLMTDALCRKGAPLPFIKQTTSGTIFRVQGILFEEYIPAVRQYQTTFNFKLC